MEYGLIGEKLGHSYSKVIHGLIGLYDYDLKEISREDLPGFLTEKDFKGLNVTIPYKETVMPYLYKVEGIAERIGCVNTIVNRDGKLYGYNTDYYGLKALIERSGLDLTDKKVLILGTGGTSKTAECVLTDLGAREIHKVSRTEGVNVITYEDAVKKHADAFYIVNTTPVGMFPNVDKAPIDLSSFKELKGVTDVIYNPAETLLVKNARALNIYADTGLYMLVTQAVKAASLFTGKEIDDGTTEKIFKELSEKL